MKTTIRVRFNGCNQIEFDEPTICPFCHHAIRPEFLGEHVYIDGEGNTFLSNHYECLNCFRTFVANYSVNLPASIHESLAVATMRYLGPSRFEPKAFDPDIEKLSPQFVEIYNQSASAESAGLNQISGIGYRKALEFLVKDYRIYKEPDKRDAIENAFLSKCINEIGDERIQTLAASATWIGNDESHYTRKQENLNIHDMKDFIDAIMYFVAMSLKVDRAAAVKPR